MTEIILKNVTKFYGDTSIIHDINLHMDSGQFIVLVGPSGCGKSTLLRLVSGLEQATSGDVIIDGESVNSVAASDRGLAMVFQSYALYPHMTVFNNMAFGLENARLPKSEILERVHQAAEMLQITPYLNRKPKALSGGQRQRVAMGRAIVREPKAFLFDEPLSNLDAELRVVMRKELTALHDKIGGTMIYVTHDQTEAMTLADKIVVLNNGRIEQEGAPLDLYNAPANTFVAGFIGSPRMNLIVAKVVKMKSGIGLSTSAGTFSIPSRVGINLGDTVSFGIRPEHISLVDSAKADCSATLDISEQLGGETYLYCSSGDLPQITIHKQGQLSIKRGEILHFQFDRQFLHLFDSNGVSV